MIKRLLQRFELDFGLFLSSFNESERAKVQDAVLNCDKHHLGIMWLDPRTRLWIEQRTNVHYHNLMKDSAMELTTEPPEKNVKLTCEGKHDTSRKTQS